MSTTAVHGGNIYAAAEELGLKPRDILDYSANINPLGPPPGLKKYLFDHFDLVEHYPDPHALGWREKIAESLGLSPGQIVAGNGTTPLMYLLCRAVKPRRAVIVAPAFAEYEQALRHIHLPPLWVECRPEDDFDLTPAVVDQALSRDPDMIFLTNPTSPAGRLVDGAIMAELLEKAEKRNCLVVLDEAFLDFTEGLSEVGALKKNRSLVVLKSLTKIFALPGLRLGYLAAGEEVIGLMEPYLEPWSVNALALAAGDFCHESGGFIERTRKFVEKERNWLLKKIGRLPVDRVVRGTANYLLVKLAADTIGEEELMAVMRKRGILIRGCASFQNLLPGYIRLAVKKRSANERLIVALAEEIASAHQIQGRYYGRQA